MAEIDETDELTKLKQWWADNGTSLLVGVILALVVIGGWYGWHWYRNRQVAQAAGIYAQVARGAQSGNVTSGMVEAVKKLQDHYSGTSYAAAGSLQLAASEVGKEDYDKAVKLLGWVVDNANNDGIRNLARVRQARVLWTQGKSGAALKLLQHTHPDSFDALYAETSGDIHAARGERAAAYKAYEHALDHLPDNISSSALQRKLNANRPASERKATSGVSRTTSKSHASR